MKQCLIVVLNACYHDVEKYSSLCDLVNCEIIMFLVVINVGDNFGNDSFVDYDILIVWI